MEGNIKFSVSKEIYNLSTMSIQPNYLDDSEIEKLKK